MIQGAPCVGIRSLTEVLRLGSLELPDSCHPLRRPTGEGIRLTGGRGAAVPIAFKACFTTVVSEGDQEFGR